MEENKQVESKKRALNFCYRFYHYIFSPLLGKNCRFYPTCSQYFYEACLKYGYLKGFLLGSKRLLRCGPWHSGGYDPVEEKCL